MRRCEGGDKRRAELAAAAKDIPHATYPDLADALRAGVMAAQESGAPLIVTGSIRRLFTDRMAAGLGLTAGFSALDGD